MAKKPTPKKETGDAVSAIAGRIMAAPDPFDFPGMKKSMVEALQSVDTRVPSDAASEEIGREIVAQRLIDAIRPCFKEWIADTRTLAASALSQDETK